MNEEIEPHISQRFDLLQIVGKGAYGIVWKAFDRTTKATVALKKVFEAFQNETDAQRTFREVVILLSLPEHENVIRLLDVIRSENRKDLYLVFEYMQSDVHSVIKSNILKAEHKQFIVYQILKALKFLHSGGVFHRDLKPSNVLINSDCYIKLCDFGLARLVATEEDTTDSIMTEYVATRWYRAPEIVFGSKTYGRGVDMWSVGCILAELINGNPLFPGKSTMGQIQLIVELLGKPTPEGIAAMDSSNTKAVLANIKIEAMIPFSSAFKTTDPVVLDFLKRALDFNPNRRMTVDEALAHEYVRPFRELAEEITIPYTITLPHNDRKFSIDYYRNALFDESIKQISSLRHLTRSNSGLVSPKAQLSTPGHAKYADSQNSNNQQKGQKQSEKRVIVPHREPVKAPPAKEPYIQKNHSFKGSFMQAKLSQPTPATQPKPIDAVRNFLTNKKDRLQSPQTVLPPSQKPSATNKQKPAYDSDNFASKLQMVKNKLGNDMRSSVVKEQSALAPARSPKAKIPPPAPASLKHILYKPIQSIPNENSKFKQGGNDRRLVEVGSNGSSPINAPTLVYERPFASSFQGKVPGASSLSHKLSFIVREREQSAKKADGRVKY